MPPDTKISNNFEIDQALKEFEAGAGPEKSQQPPEINQREESGIKFETDSYKAIKFYDETDTPKIVRLVMKYSGGAIKDQKIAEYVLFGFVILAIIISLFLFFGGRGGSPSLSDQEELNKILNVNQ